MTNKWAVTTAVFINYVLGLAVFMAPEEDVKSYIGPMPGLIILISIAILISDIQLVPLHYKQEYVKTFFTIEVIFSLLFCEFFMIKVWTRIEGFIFSMIKFLLGRGNLFEEMGGTSFMSLLVSGIALSFLFYALNATNSVHTLIETVVSFYNHIESSIKKLKSFGGRCKTAAHDPQMAECIPIQVYACPPQKVTPVNKPYRNPHCPIHGDHEINGQSSRRSRS